MNLSTTISFALVGKANKRWVKVVENLRGIECALNE
jgi:hypothetical protein